MIPGREMMWGHPGKRRKRRAMAFLGVALMIGASGCASSSSYMGISMIPGEASPGIRALAQRAQAGDKQAQLDLGIRFEEGNGVPQDNARAMKLYRAAAADSGGTMWVYAPSPGNGAPARVIPVDRGPRQAGLDEAKSRLSCSNNYEGSLCQ